ncbi:MAG: PDGLE domain-containing protein [Candidatus Omnitrophota bacterium]
MRITLKLCIGLAILIILSPIGIILPGHFLAGSAWGEWGLEEIEKLAGYIPPGLAKLSILWNAPIPDYAFKGWESKGLLYLSAAYIVSAIFGIAATAVLMLLIGKMLAKKGD